MVVIMMGMMVVMMVVVGIYDDGSDMMVPCWYW